MYKLILLDLDGTLLDSRKNISEYTLNVLQKCRSKGMLIGIATARSEMNAKRSVSMIKPDVVISNSGALVRCRGDVIYSLLFSEEETMKLVQAGIAEGCEVTVDTPNKSYWNYKIHPREMSADWNDTVYTDYSDFHEKSFKVCIQTTDLEFSEKTAAGIENCTCTKFSDCDWFKFSKAGASKEKAIPPIEKALGISSDEIIAFGDDYVDIEMLKYCGRGIAMENAIDEVKNAADEITCDNDSDGVAIYLERNFLQ